MHLLDEVRKDHYEIYRTDYDAEGNVTYDGPINEYGKVVQYLRTLEDMEAFARSDEEYRNRRLRTSPLLYERDGRRVECYVVQVTTVIRRAVG